MTLRIWIFGVDGGSQRLDGGNGSILKKAVQLERIAAFAGNLALKSTDLVSTKLLGLD